MIDPFRLYCLKRNSKSDYSIIVPVQLQSQTIKQNQINNKFKIINPLSVIFIVKLLGTSLIFFKFIFPICIQSKSIITIKLKIQMSQIQSESKREKTKQEYSRNIKKLKIKLTNVQNQIVTLQKKIESFSNVSNDKLLSMKIAKFCKERRFTPQMLFRFADKTGSKSVSKLSFRQTLTNLGLKLSKEQFMRLQYLIDEDISGEIAFDEYNQYLEAFGMKKQFTPGFEVAREALGKLDIDKLIKMNEQNKENSDVKKKKHQNLLNYEQFRKYCLKHFPNLKDKQLAYIFTRLEKNQLINLQDLIDYLENQEAEKKRLQQKNKKKIVRKQSLIKQFTGDKTLKSIIQVLLKSRSKSTSPTFHSIQFSKLQKILGTKRGQLLKLFQQIDHKRKGTFKGSFTFNQLINYYIQKGNKNQINYAFELMGNKFLLLNQSPQNILGAYSGDKEYIKEQELRKFLQEQFQTMSQQYHILMKEVGKQSNGQYSIQKIIDLMKLQNENKQIFIKPNNVPAKLMPRNGLQAFRICLQIEQKLIKMKQAKWNDYEFGPTESDQQGSQSINLHLPSENIRWSRCEQLGMNQFYQQAIDFKYLISSSCPSQAFAKTLLDTINIQNDIFYPKSLQTGVRDIQQQHLTAVFNGLYPRVFHHFSKYGMYVIKIFLKEKWRYVIIDDKIPCSQENSPYFSCISGFRYSFLSIVEKAYAKALGSYESLYSNSNYNKYIVQLTNCIPFEYNLSKKTMDQVKNSFWQSLLKFQKEELKVYKESKTKEKQKFVYGIMRSKVDSQARQILLNTPLKILQFLQISDNKSKNSHKSHRLMILRNQKPLQKQSLWNKSWNREQAGNKYSQLSMQIADKLTSPTMPKQPNNILLNYKLFRSFLNLYRIEPVNYSKMIILRKQLQFQQKFKCRYEITAKSTLEFAIVMNRKSAKADAKINIDFRNSKQQLISHQNYKQELFITSYLLEKNESIIAQIYVDNWKNEAEYKYTLSMYMMHPRYQLKQRDRHLLFRFVSPYQEEEKFVFSDFEQVEKQFIYKNFYKAAQRKGCCG